jgi:hypothetical protein
MPLKAQLRKTMRYGLGCKLFRPTTSNIAISNLVEGTGRDREYQRVFAHTNCLAQFFRYLTPKHKVEYFNVESYKSGIPMAYTYPTSIPR